MRINRLFAMLITLLLAADWGSKLWITNRLALGESWELVDGWLYFIHRHNTGVAFSLLADLPDLIRIPLLCAFSMIGIVLFARIILSSPDRWVQIAAVVVIAGAAGNLGERIFLGGVTDFVFIIFLPFVFNVADIAITVGGAVLALRLVAEERRLTPTRAAV